MSPARDTAAFPSAAAPPLLGERRAAGGEAAGADRVQVLEDTLRDVLSHIRPQGSPHWELNTCLVTNEKLATWWSALGVTPRWETTSDQ
ncbi:hypothetical protein [Streptomyces flaveolus]|uniref:hypothetical protein n=1 Tax=Streptomyces flaveolus TaxID=67297 RepID=UPI00166FFD28|nr:hypothetical protein [Streptomyces flaveolus]GGQ85031.1 hypothetical protein GCM10010216_53540 [Streptomyces flaveolus]